MPHILCIHNDVILHTTAIWEEEPEKFEQRAAWFNERRAAGFPVLVTESGGKIVAYGSFGTFRARCGYRRTIEHSVHVRPDRRGKGIGTAMIEELIRIARAQNRHAMIGGISADNEGSIRLHQRLGFYETGYLKEVGYKFGRWLDLVFMQKLL